MALRLVLNKMHLKILYGTNSLKMRNGLKMNDKEYIPLSWLSQMCYCPRRAALLLNERVWVENVETAKGRAEHERVHTQRKEENFLNSMNMKWFPKNWE